MFVLHQAASREGTGGVRSVSEITSKSVVSLGTNVEAPMGMRDKTNPLDELVIASIHRYEGVGYTERFDTALGGLRSEQTGVVHPADALVAEHVVALESASPDCGPALLFALRSQVDGSRGTWVVCRDAELPREAQCLVARLASADTWTRRVPLGGAGAGEFVPEGMMVGLIGAVVVALWFLLVDAVEGEPLATPSLVADRLFGHDLDSHALTIDLARVSAVVALHGGLFVLFGIAAAWCVSRYVKRASLPGLFVALFAVLEVAALLGGELVIPGAAPAVLVANALAAFAMALYLRRSEPHPAHPDRTVVWLWRDAS